MLKARFVIKIFKLLTNNYVQNTYCPTTPEEKQSGHEIWSINRIELRSIFLLKHTQNIWEASPTVFRGGQNLTYL